MDILKLLEIVKDPDLKLKINELYGENLHLKEKNYELRKKVEQLSKVKDISSKLSHEDNHYFLNEKNEKDGPFCTKCWDSEFKLVRTHKGSFNSGEQNYTCPNCKTHTSTGTYNPPSSPDYQDQW